MKGLLFALITIILVGITTAAICGVVFAIYLNDYVNPHIDIDLDSFRLNFTSSVCYVDEKGTVQTLADISTSENRVWADYSEMPPMLINAFISTEDSRFNQHNGVDWIRTIGATINYIIPIRDNYGGGSTITQQLIKNLTGDDTVSIKRKIQEIMRALELEKNYEKEEILEMYLNTIYFSQGAYGVKQAALTYFDKELSELTVAECAALAGIVKNPYAHDLRKFPETNKARRATVLRLMMDNGILTEVEYQEALAEEVIAVKRTDSSDDEESSGYMSYFTEAVIDAVVNDLMEQKGYSENLAKQMLYGGGLQIVSTIDLDIQAKMDAVFKDTENFPGILGNDGTYPQAAMVIIDPYTGYVKALYGGRGEKTGNLVLNRAVGTRRSPGSSIKPISVYAPAIEYGLITPASVIDDQPQNFEYRASGWPKNENGRYYGLTMVYDALARSQNPVAVNIVEQLGYRRSYDFASNNMGISSLVERLVKTNKDGSQTILSDMGASALALGGFTNGVTVLDMTAAYAAFVNHGVYTTPVLYTKVYDSDGKVILDNEPIASVAMSQKTADYMIELLTGAVTRTGGTARKAAIEGMEVGGKTGTTQDSVDRWFAGVTPYYTGVVWFGYDYPQDIKGVSEINPALYLWREVMTAVHADLAPASFERSTELISVEVCADSGLLMTDACRADPRGSRGTTVKLAEEDIPTKYCSTHRLVEIDSANGMIANEYCPPRNIVQVGLLDIQRLYPYDGVNIADQQYCIPYSGTVIDDVRMYPAYSFGYSVCTEHTHHISFPIPTYPLPTEPERTEPED